MAYKLTDEKGQTYGDCQWGEGATHTAKGKTSELCSEGVIHYYDDALLAVFANPIHANFSNPILWEFEPLKKIGGDSLKSVCKSGTTIRQIPLPEIITEQRVEIAIRCAMAVYREAKWVKWAQKWLSGEDRTWNAAKNAAESAAKSAARSAAWSAAWSAAKSAENAAWSAAENAENAAKSAARSAAESAAKSAARSAAENNLDIITIIHQVVKEGVSKY